MEFAVSVYVHLCASVCACVSVCMCFYMWYMSVCIYVCVHMCACVYAVYACVHGCKLWNCVCICLADVMTFINRQGHTHTHTHCTPILCNTPSLWVCIEIWDAWGDYVTVIPIGSCCSPFQNTRLLGQMCPLEQRTKTDTWMLYPVSAAV